LWVTPQRAFDFIQVNWPSGGEGDSNPRYGYPYNSFRDRRPVQAEIGTGGKVDSRWLQVQDLDLFSDSVIMKVCSV
jgi:hypothetical protein